MHLHQLFISDGVFVGKFLLRTRHEHIVKSLKSCFVISD